MPERQTRLAALLVEATAVVALFALIALYVTRQIWDIDVFWHITAGRAFREAGELFETDVFSAVDPGRAWFTFQWGYEVLVSWLDDLGGLELVRHVHAWVMLTAFAAFWAGCRFRLGMSALGALTVVALLVVLYEDRINVRPHVLNLLGWSLCFPWVVRGPQALGRRATLLMAAVVAAWANLHAGGCFLFLGVAAALPAGAALDWLVRVRPEARDDARRAATWWGASTLVAVCSPHFVRGNAQQLMMMQGSEHQIEEWAPSWHFFEIASTPGHWFDGAFPSLVALFWVALVASTLALVHRVGWRQALARRALWALGASLALLLLAHRSGRFVDHAGIAWLLLWPMLREIAGERLPPLLVTLTQGVMAAGLVGIAYHFNVVALHGSIERTFNRAIGAEGPLDARRFPVDPADWLEANGFEGRVFCQPNWGGYLLYRLWPRITVTADGRGNYERAFADDLMALYDPAVRLDPARGEEIRAIYERHPVDLVVHQRPAWPPGYQPDPRRWRPLYLDRQAEIWLRNTPATRAWLERKGHLDRFGWREPGAVSPGAPGAPTPRPRGP